MNQSMSRIVSFLATVFLLPAWGFAAEDWPNFRGPKHNGISEETGLRVKWDSTIPLVWERNVGSAFSSFSCVGDRCYTCGTESRQQVLLCLNADSGEVVWQVPFEKAYVERQGGDGTRATPTVNDGKVYVLGAKGKLLCADATTGKEVWSKQFSHEPKWGYSSSVLVEDNLAISSGGEDQGALIAYDKKTGQEVWKSGNDPAGYATPYPFSFEGARYVVGFTGQSAIVLEMKTGKQALRIPWETSYEVNAAAPIFHDGHLFIGSGYRTGSAVFKLRKQGEGLAAEEVWRNTILMPKFQSCILHDGKLFVSDQKALVCADFLSGKELWRKPHIQNGTLVLADRHFFLLTEGGELQIAEASDKDWNPITTKEILEGRSWCVPVLYRGRLYARDLERLVCLDLKGTK
ncbi:MAG: PQQ-binding-like beta-propeller repeat protein [Planctomycetota bacterium]|mgnify:CR=1 FL=1